MPLIDITLPFTWIILGGTSMSVVVLGYGAWHLPKPRRRALLGCLVMAGIVLTSARSLLVFAPRGPRLSKLLLPLLVPILVLSVYRLTFPVDSPATHPAFAGRWTFPLLALFTGLALVGAGLLVTLDYLLP